MKFYLAFLLNLADQEAGAKFERFLGPHTERRRIQFQPERQMWSVIFTIAAPNIFTAQRHGAQLMRNAFSSALNGQDLSFNEAVVNVFAERVDLP